jgi:hypothetical protein
MIKAHEDIGHFNVALDTFLGVALGPNQFHVKGATSCPPDMYLRGKEEPETAEVRRHEPDKAAVQAAAHRLSG